MIAAAAGGLGYVFMKSPVEAPPQEGAEAVAVREEPKIESFIEFDPLMLEIGYGLIPLVEEGRGELLAKVKAMRRQLATEIGFIVPPIHIKDNLQLRPHEYSFSIRGIEIVRNEIMMGHLLAVAGEGAGTITGIPTKEPAFGLPAYWIGSAEAEKAQVEGYMVVDPANVIATHLTELIKKHCSELLTRTEVQNLLDSVAKSYPKLIDELIPVHLTLGGVQRVLQNLLKERVPINDLVTILETLVDFAPTTKDIDLLTENVRQALSRFITRQYAGRDGSIPVMTLDPKFERVLYQTVETGDAISPDSVNRLLRGIEGILKNDRIKGIQPIVLCSPQIRRFLKKLMEKFLPAVVVLSNAEISSAARIYTIGMVRYED
jgi:flagellar biosynthesis protein FlhA